MSELDWFVTKVLPHARRLVISAVSTLAPYLTRFASLLFFASLAFSCLGVG